jgi:hypothetical protein
VESRLMWIEIILSLPFKLHHVPNVARARESLLLQNTENDPLFTIFRGKLSDLLIVHKTVSFCPKD